jgi:small subunit ribosomal protein S4
MGDPRKVRKSYSAPVHPWQKERIDAEKVLMKKYGLKNKKEMWKMASKVKRYIARYKMTNNATGPQSEKEKQDLLQHLVHVGIIKEGATGETILGLGVEEILERRLQTILFKKNMAHSMQQARQFIVHRHITVAGKIITSPSFIVPLKQEHEIEFAVRSPLMDANHPERVVEKTEEVPKTTEEVTQEATLPEEVEEINKEVVAE